MKIATTGMVVLALCFGTVGFIGCGGEEGGSETTASDATGAGLGKAGPVGPVNRVVDLKTKKGEDVDVQFRSDGSGTDHAFPVYPGANEAAAMTIPGEGSLTSFSTTASITEVFEYYVKELEAQGWTITKKNDEKHNIKAEQGEKKASFKILDGGQGTEIAVIIEGA